MTDPFLAFRAAVESRDIDGAVDLFAPDATFWSPVVHKPYQGREPLRAILKAVLTVFEDFHYTGEYADTTDAGAGHVLRFACRIDDRALDGVDILRAAGDTLTELTVLVRPYSATTLLRERMAALLG